MAGFKGDERRDLKDLLRTSRFTEIGALLDELHTAAALGNLHRYFGCYYDEESRFLGTDASENWKVGEFFEYAKPHFNGKAAWIYRPLCGKRKIVVYGDKQFATFDELLESESFLCTARGTGTLIKHEGCWFVAAYYLSFPIPNPLAAQTCKIIHNYEANEASDVAQRHAEELLRELELEVEGGLTAGGGGSTANGSSKTKGKGKKKQTGGR